MGCSKVHWQWTHKQVSKSPLVPYEKTTNNSIQLDTPLWVRLS